MPHRRAFSFISGNAYVLLLLTTLLWSGNAVAARLAVGEVSPMLLVLLRWSLACAALMLMARNALSADWPVLKRHVPYCFFMGAFGYTGFNALFYASGYHTTAINIAILQGSIPVIVIITGAILLRERTTAIQWVGTVITLLGVVAVASGDVAQLARFTFNFGDLLILIASAFYAIYTVGLRKRPAVSGLGFFAAMSGAAIATSIPLAVGEYMLGQVVWPSMNGWLLILFIAFGPSLLSQLMFMRGVQLIGPVRSGLFINLVPVFGPIMAVVILGEKFGWHHALGLTLVLSGIYVAERERMLNPTVKN